MPSLRTLLILSRGSNLPTVWSNCLAAWWLGGGGHVWGLPVLLLGASLLYIGGMFLNDAVDANFDRQHRRERPIPSGQVSERSVWGISAGLLATGAILVIALGVLPVQPPAEEDSTKPLPVAGSIHALAASELRAEREGRSSSNVAGDPSAQEPPSIRNANTKATEVSVPRTSRERADQTKRGTTTVGLTLALVALIVFYDFIHKAAAFSPLLMGGCRTLLFLDAASVGQEGLTGLAVWSGLALGAYVAGLSYFARLERMLRRPQWWPCLLLAVPLGLAFVVNAAEYRRDSMLLSLILGLWIVRSLRPALASSQQNVSRSVARLLAGIALVDLLAICGAPREFSMVFLFLFCLTLLFQRFIPAT